MTCSVCVRLRLFRIPFIYDWKQKARMSVLALDFVFGIFIVVVCRSSSLSLSSLFMFALWMQYIDMLYAYEMLKKAKMKEINVAKQISISSQCVIFALHSTLETQWQSALKYEIYTNLSSSCDFGKIWLTHNNIYIFIHIYICM